MIDNRNHPRIRLFWLTSTMRKALVLSLLFTLYSLLPVWKESVIGVKEWLDIPSGIEGLVSLMIGLLLVFRTNASYAKWWEARTLWGGLVNCSRNLAIKVHRLREIPDEELQRMQKLIIGFPYALKEHLRSGVALNDVPGFEDANEQPRHVPAFLASQIYDLLGTWRKKGLIDGDDLRVIDRDAALLMDICGGCERIRKTRISRSYRKFVHQCVVIYVLTFPWGIVNDFLWLTPPLTFVTSYFMIGLELVGDAIDEPFGLEIDDLDLESLCSTIKASVTEILDS